MKPVSGKRMCRILERHGWTCVRIKGGHRAYQKPGNSATVIVPVHGNKDPKAGTQHGITRDAGLSQDDLRRCYCNLRQKQPQLARTAGDR